MELSVCERFTKFVGEPTENGCWPWLGTRQKSGHGYFSYNSYPIQAYRMSWILVNGPIPNNLHILHSCDNGWCVNPDHLHLGTHQDNMKEKMDRGRNINPPQFKG